MRGPSKVTSLAIEAHKVVDNALLIENDSARRLHTHNAPSAALLGLLALVERDVARRGDLGSAHTKRTVRTAQHNRTETNQSLKRGSYLLLWHEADALAEVLAVADRVARDEPRAVLADHQGEKIPG